MATAEPIRNKKQIKEISGYFIQKGQPRNHLLVTMGFYTALRISDLLRLQWDDVYDFERQEYRQRIHVTEKKTGKHKCIALNKAVIRALRRYAGHTRAPGRYLFENNRKLRGPISRIQAYRIIRAAANAVGLRGQISCHSLRKTFGYHAWKSGVPVAVIMDIYNHSSFSITRRYLGVSQDDKDEVYQKMSF